MTGSQGGGGGRRRGRFGGWNLRARRRGELQTSSGLIGSLLGKHSVKREMREHRVAVHWARIVGDRVAARTTPDGLSKGVLWVRVANSAWLHELSFLRDRIAERVNELTGDPPLVREVRFHLEGKRGYDPEDALAPTMRIRRPRKGERPLPPPAQGRDRAQIENETERVEDSELRDAIRQARIKLNL